MPPPHSDEAIPAAGVELPATVTVPPAAPGVVLFAHGSGSSRHSPRNQQVARGLEQVGLATVLVDLLTPDEEEVDLRTRRLRFDIALLAQRLAGITDWLGSVAPTADLPIGLFGASTGGAAALVTAAERPDAIRAVVSRGGRPDLAGDALPRVRAATLLIVGGRDETVLGLNRRACEALTCEKRLEVVPGATHLFEEPGALEQVTALAADWFRRQLGSL